MEKKAVTDRKSELKIYDRLPLKVRKDSGIRDGLEYAAQATGMSMTQYAANAIKEKLQRDGYLKKEE